MNADLIINKRAINFQPNPTQLMGQPNPCLVTHSLGSDDLGEQWRLGRIALYRRPTTVLPAPDAVAHLYTDSPVR